MPNEAGSCDAFRLAVVHEKTNQVVGLDLGLKTAVVGSNGEIFDYKMSKSERRRRKRADRRLSRKAPKGVKNLPKTISRRRSVISDFIFEKQIVEKISNTK